MRFGRTLALLGVALLALALGPGVLLVAAGALAVPRVRSWLRPTRRTGLALGAALTVVVALVVVVPDGWLPIPPGTGALVTPGYVGRPAFARPVRVGVPTLPAPTGSTAAALAPAGPLGESPQVDSAWYGREQCVPVLGRRGRLVARCRDRRGPALRVIDPETLRPLATKALPAPDVPADLPAGTDEACRVGGFYLDERDRAVVATADRRLLVVATADAEGDADLTTAASYDLSPQVPSDDCVVALAPDGAGRTWFATARGRVGVLDPRTGRAQALDLEEAVANPLAVAADGVYAITTDALYRLRPGPRRPVVAWRASYDRGTGTRSGQLTQGSGSAPALLPGGLVALTDNAEPRLHVVVRRRSDGAKVCERSVFGADAGATEADLVVVGGGVVVTDNHGYGGRFSSALGRITEPGVARVDVRGGTCTLVWTSDVVVAGSAPTLSPATGLLYATTKRRSWWGAAAWYLSGIDARTGRTVFSVRTGLGAAYDGGRGAPVLGTGAAVYVPTVAGLVRVRDRAPGQG